MVSEIICNTYCSYNYYLTIRGHIIISLKVKVNVLVVLVVEPKAVGYVAVMSISITIRLSEMISKWPNIIVYLFIAILTRNIYSGVESPAHRKCVTIKCYFTR